MASLQAAGLETVAAQQRSLMLSEHCQLQVVLQELHHNSFLRPDGLGQFLAEILGRWVVVLQPTTEAHLSREGSRVSCVAVVLPPADAMLDMAAVTHIPASELALLVNVGRHYVAAPAMQTVYAILAASLLPAGFEEQDATGCQGWQQGPRCAVHAAESSGRLHMQQSRRRDICAQQQARGESEESCHLGNPSPHLFSCRA